MQIPMSHEIRTFNSNMTKLNVHFMQAVLKVLLVVLQKELEKQRRLEREQELQKKARDHYESILLRKLGMVPWKRLREQAKENLVVSAEVKGKDCHHGRKGKRMDAEGSTNLNGLLSRVEMAKQKFSLHTLPYVSALNQLI